MNPGQAQMEKGELEKVKNACATCKPLNLDGNFGNVCGDLCQIVQKNPEQKYGSCSTGQILIPRDS
jgi:hypothetical protein